MSLIILAYSVPLNSCCRYLLAKKYDIQHFGKFLWHFSQDLNLQGSRFSPFFFVFIITETSFFWKIGLKIIQHYTNQTNPHLTQTNLHQPNPCQPISTNANQHHAKLCSLFKKWSGYWSSKLESLKLICLPWHFWSSLKTIYTNNKIGIA